MSTQIINHRRVVQEVYDRRILHKLLNVKPRIIVVTDDPEIKALAMSNGRHTSQILAKAEPGATNENPIDLEDGEIPMVISSEGDRHIGANDDEENDHSNNLHRRRRDDRSSSDSEDDSGKYGINGRQPPKKRMKTGGEMDIHTSVTIYTTDDDEDEDGSGTSSESELDSVAEEEAEYDVDVIDVDEGMRVNTGKDAVVSEPVNMLTKAESKPLSNGGNEKKRSYWLSKGIVSGDVDIAGED